MNLRKNLGIMQGRLSKWNGKLIQYFPKKTWKSEFRKAKKIGFNFIEWTLDQKDLYLNPIFNLPQIKKINYLKKKYKIEIKTLTGDCFMQKPFWKIKKNKNLIKDLLNIIKFSKKIEIEYIIIPLVDKGSLKNKFEEKKLIFTLKKITKFLKKNKIQILFESDYNPEKLKKFILNFDTKYFGINYDTGNSAHYGYNIDDEFKLYGKYIKNVHIKDRIYKGGSVRLGYGSVNFYKLFKNLKKINYKKLLIFQTARALKKNNDFSEAKKNFSFINSYLDNK